jgi:hypothetical protein
LPRPDGGGVVEEGVFFFLLGQLGEFGVEWVLGCEERLFAMQDWRVGAGVVFEAIDLGGAERRSRRFKRIIHGRTNSLPIEFWDIR